MIHFTYPKLPPHHPKITESHLLPELSWSGFFRNPPERNLCFDPEMTPCPVPVLWGTLQLEIKPVLYVSRIPISDNLQPQGDAESERVNNRRKICEIKRGAAALNMHHIHFLCMSALRLFVVKTATACRANIFPPQTWRRNSFKHADMWLVVGIAVCARGSRNKVMVYELLGFQHAWIVCFASFFAEICIWPWSESLSIGLASVTICPISLPDGCVESVR